MANQIVWCDIPVHNLDRAIRFYSAVLGAPITKEEAPGTTMGVLPHAGDGVGGCLFRSDTVRPSSQGPLVYLNCDGRLDEAVDAVERHGGRVVESRRAIGSHGFRAIIFDSEGNRIALHSTT